jgi:hypothetical protein
MSYIRHLAVAAAASGLLCSCVKEVPPSKEESSQNPTFASEKCAGKEQEPGGFCGVSLVDLIANPTQFVGHQVMVKGYVHLAFEGNAIYLHKEDYLHGLSRNGLWVDLAVGVDGSKCQDRYSIVEGTFVRGGPSGHLGLWSGAIENVTRCEGLANTTEAK